jgi:hypothetical protein
MPNINAAAGCTQMEQLPQFLQAKRNLAEEYGCILIYKWAIANFGFVRAIWGQAFSVLAMNLISSIYILYLFKTHKIY